MAKRHRRKPYTEAGIRRLKCFRCGGPARTQWSICADGNRARPLCVACDVALNVLVLRWVRHPDAARMAADYREKMKRRYDG